jgi:serine/threonine-protein kinase
MRPTVESRAGSHDAAIPQPRLCCSVCRAIYRSDFLRCPTDGTALEPCIEDPIVGTTIGEHYVIDACVGEGAMGRVYRSHHARLERRQFAVKVLLGDLAATIAMRLRFAQEAEAASRLDHPNVVPVLDFGKTPAGLLYLAMEFVEGRTLAEVIADEGPLAPDRVIALARQLSLGLAHAHAQGLVHRDFKPDNVIVVGANGAEVPRILDFGLAVPHDTDSARLTSAGMSVGTPAYAAPEQVSSGEIDPRSDLFALGVTMYEMLSGKVPFDGNMLEVMHLNASEDPPPIGERTPGVMIAPALERLVRTLMAREKEARFATAHDVTAAIDRLALEPQAPPVTAPRASTPRLRSAWRWPIALLALLTAAAVIAVGVLAFQRWREGDAPRAGIASSPSPVARANPPPVAIAPTPTPPPPAPTPPPPAPTPPPPVAAHKHAPRAITTHGKHAPVPVSQGSAAIVVAHEDPTPGSDVAPPPPPIAPPPPLIVSEDPKGPSRTTKPITDARVAIDELSVDGSLSDLQVRRAIDRAEPALRACYLAAHPTARTATAHAHFEIDESRRAIAISADSALTGLGACAAAALHAVRTESPPDVGNEKVTVTFTFTGLP